MIKGQFYDILKDKSGDIIRTIDWRNNNIMLNMGKLIAALMKSDPNYTVGVSYMKLGQGAVAWDDMTDEERLTLSPNTLTALYNPLTEAEVTISYIDDNGDDTSTLTNKLKLQATFTNTSGSAWSIREFGLFGGGYIYDSATDYEMLLNHKTHDSVPVEDSESITRLVKLTF